MTRVARAFGQSPVAVLDWPWEDVLLAWYGLEEVERIDRLEDEVAALHRFGFLSNYAINDPKKLLAEQRQLRARLQAGDADAPVDEAALLRDALAFGAQIKKNTEAAS